MKRNEYSMFKILLIIQLVMFVLNVSNLQAADQDNLLDYSIRNGGLVVRLGVSDPDALIKLRLNNKVVVQGLDSNHSEVVSARKYLNSHGVYGEITVAYFDGEHLPYADNLINLFIADKPGKLSKEEILRVLVPLGVAYIKGEKIIKPWPEEIDEWGYFLHSSDNNAVADDTQVGMPRNIQWINGTKWARSHEELSTISTSVSAQGRIFYIVDKAPLAYISFNPSWQLVARDAFNGLFLWSREIPKWVDHMRQFRSGPTHLPRRLIAVKDKIYVTLGLDAPLSELDAATGKTIKEYKGTEWTEEVLYDRGVLYLLIGSSERRRFGSGLFDREEPAKREDRFLVAINADTGEELWRKNAGGKDFIMPQGIAISGGKLFYRDIKGIGCLDTFTGKKLWFTERKSPQMRYGFSTCTLVATPDVVLLADRDLKGEIKEAETDINWAIGGWNEAPLGNKNRKGKGSMIAYSTSDGSKLWQQPCSEGYNSPVDLFVVNNLVWIGAFYGKQYGYDLMTGKVVKTIDTTGDKVGMPHHRCYRNKASVKYIFEGRDGVELIDLNKGWIRNNSWTRGPCQFGIMPCNGLIYVPTDPCACHLKTRMHGFKAYSSQKLRSITQRFSEKGRLTKGPAYPKRNDLASVPVDKGAWPMYRHDSARSGAADLPLTLPLKLKWSTNLGGTLTQPVSANGIVYVAVSDRCAVYALNAETGEILWSYLTDGKIDSSPTIYKGMILFGSSNGKVYCLDAVSGSLVWSFDAAPEKRMITVYGELESTWPVHGSVIVQNNELYFIAGRSSYLSGGIYFYRMDPVSGKLLTHNVISNIDPLTEKQIGAQESRFDSDGVVSDILSANKDYIFLKHLQLDKNGKEVPSVIPHLFSPTSLLDEEWFVRTYWTFAPKIVAAGYGGWPKTANLNPSGRIMVFNNDKVFGYGRKKVAGARAGHRCNRYHLFSSDKQRRDMPAKNKKIKEIKKHYSFPEKVFLWSKNISITVRAMAYAPQQLIVAGVPNLSIRQKPFSPMKEPEKYKEEHRLDHGNERLRFKDPVAAKAAFTGKKGASIQFLSPADGTTKIADDIALKSSPVADGISISEDRLLVSLKNGYIECYSGK